MPQLAGCPLHHWTPLELQRYFEIYTPLTPQTAPAIWEETAEKLKAYDAVSLLEKMNVRVLCTTDDPADALQWHRKIAADPTISFQVLPSFRPDKYLGGNPDAERALCEKFGTDNLPEALEKALDYFCANGCKVADHGFIRFSYLPGTQQARLMHLLGRAYHARGVAMQLHLGAIRNQNPRIYEAIGPDAGGIASGNAENGIRVSEQMVSQRRSTTFSKVAKTSFRKPRFRISFQICSIGFISGVYGGIWKSTIFSGTSSVPDLCHAAPSQHIRMVSCGNCLDNSRRNRFIHAVLQ